MWNVRECLYSCLFKCLFKTNVIIITSFVFNIFISIPLVDKKTSFQIVREQETHISATVYIIRSAFYYTSINRKSLQSYI